jgi:hypothetical protein
MNYIFLQDKAANNARKDKPDFLQCKRMKDHNQSEDVYAALSLPLLSLLLSHPKRVKVSSCGTRTDFPHGRSSSGVNHGDPRSLGHISLPLDMQSLSGLAALRHEMML